MKLKWMLRKQVGECQPESPDRRGIMAGPCECDIECFVSVSFGLLLD